jgi:hypothetical protein
MGVWGAGIFSDDIAADVRDEYRDCLAEGLDGVAATEKVLVSFKDSQDDPDDGPPFWLSLAATQFRYGRLEDRVRDRALKSMDDGSDIARFEGNEKLKRARMQVLQRLRVQLVGPQREPTKVRREIPSECDWEAGEIVGYKRDSGERIPLHVQGIGEMRHSRYPVVCVLATSFEHVGEANDRTPVRRVLPRSVRQGLTMSESVLQNARWGPAPDCFPIFGIKKRDLTCDRIRRTAKRIKPKFTFEGNGIPSGSPCIHWKHFETFINEHIEPSAHLELGPTGSS